VVASTGKTDERQWLLDLGAADVIGRHDLDEDPDRVLGPQRWAGPWTAWGDDTGPDPAHTALRRGGGRQRAHRRLDLETTVFPFITATWR